MHEKHTSVTPRMYLLKGLRVAPFWTPRGLKSPIKNTPSMQKDLNGPHPIMQGRMPTVHVYYMHMTYASVTPDSWQVWPVKVWQVVKFDQILEVLVCTCDTSSDTVLGVTQELIQSHIPAWRVTYEGQECIWILSRHIRRHKGGKSQWTTIYCILHHSNCFNCHVVYV